MVIDHVLKAYWWLPQHPVTLQSTFSTDEGHSHVAQGQEEEWRHTDHCLFALKVNCSLELKHSECDGRL